MKKGIDISKNILVPKHFKLSEKEKQKVFEKYKVSLAELPKIFSTDPAIKNLDAKEGDVIRVIRNSQTSGQSVFYRGVINA